MDIEIKSFYKLTPSEIAEIIKRLNLPKTTKVNNKIDQSIIGGMIIKYQGKTIDLSLKKQLNNLKNIDL